MPLVCPDVQLICGSKDEVISCHSLMLATHSSLLSHVLLDVSDTYMEDITIFLPDFTKKDILNVLDVMYGKLDNCQASQSLLCALGIKHPNEKSAQETFISKEMKEPNDMNHEENTSKSRT